MNIPTITDTVVYGDFVQPSLCIELKKAGLLDKGMFQWVGRNGGLQLESRAFDYDKYYVDAEKLLSEVSPPDFVAPAYTIKDVERCCPELKMYTYKGKYCIEGMLLPFEKKVEHERLPDAFAMYLISLINSGAVSLQH